MGARTKLNQAYLNGALIVAAAIGLLAQSWTVFIIAALIGIGLSLYAGEIRPRGRRRDS